MIEELLEKKELSEEKSKWRNIVFDLKGKRWTGKVLWDSKEEADRFMKNIIPHRFKDAGWDMMEGEFPCMEYSWHMQVLCPSK